MLRRRRGAGVKIGIMYPWGHLLSERQAGASKRFGLTLDYLTGTGAEVRVLAPGGWTPFERDRALYVSFRPSEQETRNARRAHGVLRALLNVATLGDASREDFMLWYHLEWRFQPSLKASMRELADWADVIFVEYTFWGAAARSFMRPDQPLILTNYDVLANQVTGSRLLKRLTLALERGGLRSADRVVCVSPEDQRTFERGYGVETEVIPHAVDLAATSAGDGETAGATPVRSPALCLFVGSAFDANIRAVAAIRRIAKLTKERYGEDAARFTVAGGCAEPGQSENFTALGPVESAHLAALYREASLILIPLPFGTGASVKTVEALGYGKPILGTRVAFRGFPVVAGVHCEVEDDLDRYPDRIAELVGDPQHMHTLGVNARAFAEQYDYRRVFSRYSELIHSTREARARAVAAGVPVARKAAVPGGSRIESCRVCDSKELTPVFDFGDQPWCNDFLRHNEVGREPYYPLRVVRCDTCATAQLDYTVPKEIMFADHTYLSGTTRTLSAHFENVARDVDVAFFAETAGKSVLDIGSNDGTQLRHFKALGYDVLGIEPANKPASIADHAGVPTIRRFFSLETASELGRKFHVVNASGVFFHLEELHSVTDGIREVLRDDGVFVIQFLYMKSILENVAFDQIYHEHLLYYTLRTVEVLLRRHGLALFDARVSPIHGGSVIAYAGHAGARPSTARLTELRASEDADGTNEIVAYKVFAERIDRMKRENLLRLNRAKASGKRIFGYGAPAKGNTLLNFFGVGTELIDFLVEKNELRRGLFSPGMHIPIVLERQLAAPPDLYYVLAWNFRDEILHNNRSLIDRGVDFYFPVTPGGAAS